MSILVLAALSPWHRPYLPAGRRLDWPVRWMGGELADAASDAAWPAQAGQFRAISVSVAARRPALWGALAVAAGRDDDGGRQEQRAQHTAVRDVLHVCGAGQDREGGMIWAMPDFLALDDARGRGVANSRA